MLPPVRPMTLFVLAVSAALRRMPRLALAAAAALLGTAGFLAGLGPRTGRPFFPHASAGGLLGVGHDHVSMGLDLRRHSRSPKAHTR
uniref:Putative secreted protein n=1 Tax=Ixodes ricinus TaxID=34613 RepID=A0A6B0U8V3_IXORI